MSIRERELSYLPLWTVIGLAGNMVIGMVVNLDVVVPAVHPGTSGSDYLTRSAASYLWALTASPFWLKIHVIVGSLLFLAGVRLLMVIQRKGRRAAKVASWVGMIALLGAGFNGASFLDFNADVSSLLMSLGFAIAISAYAFGFLSGRAAPEEPVRAPGGRFKDGSRRHAKRAGRRRRPA